MLCRIRSFHLLSGLVSFALSLLTGPSCTDIIIPVTFSAQNLVLPVASTGPIYTTVNGTYNIAARFCEPQHYVRSRKNTLQLLIHGATYDRNYWSGDGPPGQGFDGNLYSWIAYAGSKGYTTLSIDRLCNGLSDHPDPVSVCQINANIEVIHQIILKARKGYLPNSKRSFSEIIFVGHSYGSIIGNSLHAKYPKDCDAAVLTGWTALSEVPEYDPVFANSIVPAAQALPSKYGHLNLSYLLINSSVTFQGRFYWPGYYDPALFDLDYSLRGTIGAGELQSLSAQFAAMASEFVGPVLVVTGQHDKGGVCPSTDEGCGIGWSPYLKSSRILYPVARYFDGYAPPKAGHCWNFHYNAVASFSVIHTWLSRHGF